MKKLLLVTLLAGVAPFAAQAESNFTISTTTANPANAQARLDFKVTIPKVLYFQVGAGALVTNVGTINEIDFAVPAASVGAGGAGIAGVGGDLASGGVTVRVLSNSGTSVNLTTTNPGPLTSGVAGAPTVPWSDIVVTPGVLPATTLGYSNAAIAHPAFVAGAAGGTSAAVNLAGTGGLVRREGSWTFNYANTLALPAGTYGDIAANNGRVTYTAAVAP